MADLLNNINELNFPEFTAKLVDGVYSTLVASQVEQVQTYVELVKQTTKELTTYINETKDDISGEEVLSFVVRVLPNLPEIKGDTTAIDFGQGEEAARNINAYKEATKVDGYTGTAITIEDGMSKEDFLLVAAIRLSANKYSLLKNMLEMGLIRLVVKNCEVETKVKFSSSSYNSLSTSANTYSSQNFAASARAGFFGRVFGISARANYNQTSVSMGSTVNTATDITKLDIGGRVYIKFKSDYKPLGSSK